MKAMGKLRIQILLEDSTWSTQYTFPKNDQKVVRRLTGNY